MTAYFVSRHRGSQEWAARRGIRAEVIVHLDPAIVRPGDVIIGTLPVHLAAEVCARGARYLHLILEQPADWRGRDLSADEMDAIGAALREFRITPA